MSKKGVTDEYEPDPSHVCDFMEMERISLTKSEIVHCKKLANYRVKLYSDRKYLKDGADATSKNLTSSDYETRIEVEYFCEKHFDIRYKQSPLPTRKLTYVKIER